MTETPESEPKGQEDLNADVDAVARIDAVPALLELILDQSGLGFAAVMRVTGERWIACAVLDRIGLGLAPGGQPDTPLQGLESFVAAPIVRQSGEAFGVICALDGKTANAPAADTLKLLRPLADLIAARLDLDEQADAAADRLRRDARLESVLESISDAFYALDRDWRYVIFNRAAEQYFGVSREDVIGRSLWEMFPQGRGTPFELYCRRAMEERVTTIFESASALRGGRTVELRVAPMSDGGIGVALNDVTERKQAEAALRESEQRLDLAVRAHGVGIFDWHILSGRVLWSEEEERLFGLEPGTFDGRIEGWRDLVAPEDFAAIRKRARDAIAAGREHLEFRFRVRRPDGQLRHMEGAARILYAPDGKAERMVGTNMDVTDRTAAEQRQRLLINELNHRVKNTLAAVQSIAAQTVRRADSLAEFYDSFEGRLMALSGAHDVLTRHQWDSADLRDVVGEVMQPFHPGERLQVAGPAVRLSPGQALAFAMAIHELATNAVKYGAWSDAAGRVRIGWITERRADQPAEVRFTWSEEGGPPVRPPSRRGFGSRLLQQGLARDLGGAVDLTFAPEGLRCHIRAPLAEAD